MPIKSILCCRRPTFTCFKHIYANIVNLQAYASCIRRLLDERKNNPRLYQQETNKTIYFLAESHALAPSEVVVNYRNSPHRITSSLITGCKAWLLANETPNEYKASLKCFFSSIPAQSAVILGFGEIDCRATEGILKACHEKHIDYHESIDLLVKAYLKFVAELDKEAQHQLLVYGVPAPNIEQLPSLDENLQNQLCDVIRLFNQSLEQACKANGLDYLDVYALTTDDNGSSNQRYHIDAYHLHPRIFAELFDGFI